MKCLTPIPLLAAAAILANTPGTLVAGLGAPQQPRCEYQANPLGIDTLKPRLSWLVNDDRRGAAQSACQIVVSTDPKLADAAAVVWDTGKVNSDASVHVEYAGKPPESGKRYYWKVRTWDGDGQASEYSEPAWFEMGLLKADDWTARWIQPVEQRDKLPELPWGRWIWNNEAEGDDTSAFFRAVFNIPVDATISKAWLRMTADDSFIAMLNGQKALDGNRWDVVRRVDVAGRISPGRNVLAVKAHNAKGPAGLIFTLRIELADGKTIDLLSGPEIRSQAKGGQNWMQSDLEDSTWPPSRVIGPYGCEPWKQVAESPGRLRSQFVRKTFQAKGGISRATLHSTGLGLYELHINGRRVGDDVFAPGWTKYEDRIQYQTRDVTGLLCEGDNAIAAVLGNGWWAGELGWMPQAEQNARSLMLLAQLRIEYADGSSQIVATDSTWKSHPSPVTRDSFYHGETHDARLEINGWDQPTLDDKQWAVVTETTSPTKLLCAQRDEPIRVTQEIKVEQISEPAKNVFIYDFGQNASGRVRLKIKGEPGTKIRLRFGEVLNPDGTLYRDNYRSAEATDYYICRGGGDETWEPIFTYRGFRFCEVTGWPGTPDRDAVVFRVLHSDARPAGMFECSHWLINRIQHCILWGQRSNMHSVPTDCPQRDERLGWMGDAQVFSPTACWNMNMASFFTKWMRDILDSQAPDGAVTDVAPSVVVKGPAAPAWGDAVIVIPWNVYRFYGDTRIIEENYDGMVRWVEYMRSNAKDGLLYDREGYGDWVPVVASPKGPLGAAYYCYSTRLLSRMAAVIGKKDDADKYGKLADRIAEAFNQAYLDPRQGGYIGGTQAANLLPLAFGITPAEKQETVLTHILNDIIARNDHLSTGFIATAYLLPTLSRFGNQELAWRIAAQCDYPSWGYMALNGATTIWERWNSDKMDPSMNSRNHFAFGAVGQWYYETLAGIQPDPKIPGFKRIIIHPQPAGTLTGARASYDSPYGRIESQWQRCGGTFTLETTIPPNTTARIFVPLMGSMDSNVVRGDWSAGTTADVVRLIGEQQGCRVYDVPAGKYRFTVNSR
ncbi:MAG TPA: glycoside hydrolase family 78 protein [Phycisphaerae bacterium]|nr:glycoside hydrolase family 78 protein [Phycisphaerae bacterium]